MRIALTLALLTVAALAQETEELQTPKEAWLGIEAAASKLGRYERHTFKKAEQQKFLAAWENGGKKAEGEQAYYLGLFLSGARRLAEAMQEFRKALDVEAVAADARMQFLAVTIAAERNGEATREDLLLAKKAGEKALEAAEDPLYQSRLQFELGSCNDRLGDSAAALAWWTAAAGTDPLLAVRVASVGAESILRSATDGEDARARTEALVKSMLALPTGLPEGNARVVQSLARRSAEQIARLGNGARLLGEPLPPWNALHAFADAKGAAGYKGQVTLIHVGSTWSASAVRSLAALRDLHAAYEDRCKLVGLWIGGMSFYESRFELDDDFKDKASGTTPAALRKRFTPGQPRGTSEEEIVVHKRFFANHKLSWDHVRVPLSEHAKTYGLRTQPLLILVDADGRVRYLRPGLLVRSDKTALADLRKRIDALLKTK